MIDLEKLLAPAPEPFPSGPDLHATRDPELMALDRLAEGKPERQYGKVYAAEDPDWRVIRDKCEALLARSKDLRIAALLARALIRLEHIEGLAAALQLLNELMARYWDTVHPAIETVVIEGRAHDDPTTRLFALGTLADQEGFLRDVRNSLLIASSNPLYGPISVRQILVAEGKLDSGSDAKLTSAQIAGMTRAAAGEYGASLRAAVKSLEQVNVLEAFLSEKGLLTHDAAPDLQPLKDLLKPVASVSAQALSDGNAQVSIAPDPAPAAQETTRMSVAPNPAPAPQETIRMTTERPPRSDDGQITSRDDVIRVLTKVCEYLEHAEPSSPAPLLIRRAQRLISRNFVEIIQELAPASLSDIQKLTGSEQK